MIENKKQESFYEKIFSVIFIVLTFLNDRKNIHPTISKAFNTICTTAISFYLIKNINMIANNNYDFLLKCTIALSCNLLLLPMIDSIIAIGFYIPKTTAMRELGLIDISTEKYASLKLTNKYAKEQPINKRVRVICISGRYLFREQQTPLGIPTPLYNLREKGRLDVIMPKSNVNNITIEQRYKTYTEEFKTEHGISNINNFLLEIDHGKNSLSQNRLNHLFEHDLLCMWRVILFEEHCVVQNYFPNSGGTHSFESPVFVFKKQSPDDEGISYYSTFDKMFNLIKELSTKS